MTWCDRCGNLGIITLFEGDLFVGEVDCLCRDDGCDCGCREEEEVGEEMGEYPELTNQSE